ncbi:MAG: D-glycero-beta-D-manno-heptose 1,7-bisphosphate 7-phosphatase [Candidatus Omnitrophica bacterium]|nr:D-glycero-beta-D-manno-heptose 1,7-bisphosphate 7-phosphatase [Candidatus Omnitrophota bacterium]
MKVIFLDRDGVINAYPGDGGYVKSWKEFKFIPGSIEGIRKLNAKGFKLFVISNQGGVNKGLYTQETLDTMTSRMMRKLTREGAHLDGVYYCIHRSDENCSCHKPKPGMLEAALREHTIKAEMSFFIGDSFMDMEAAQSFGAKPVLVLSGKERISNRSNWKFEPDFIFDNLLVAAHYLCNHYG